MLEVDGGLLVLDGRVGGPGSRRAGAEGAQLVESLCPVYIVGSGVQGVTAGEAEGTGGARRRGQRCEISATRRRARTRRYSRLPRPSLEVMRDHSTDAAIVVRVQGAANRRGGRANADASLGQDEKPLPPVRPPELPMSLQTSP